MRAFWASEGFLEIHSPSHGESSESGAELFTVDYFGGKAYLAQSPQFLQADGMAALRESVRDRAVSVPTRPLRLDTRQSSQRRYELSWIESHEDVMRLEERWLRDVVSESLGGFTARTSTSPRHRRDGAKPPLPADDHGRGSGVLVNLGTYARRTPGRRPGRKGENFWEYVAEHFGHDFLFVTDYDWKLGRFTICAPIEAVHHEELRPAVERR